MGKERKPDFTPGLPVAGKVPRSMREKMDLQASHQRGREGAAKKRIIMKGPTLAITRMSPQPINADGEAVNFGLMANGYVLKGSTLEELPIDPDDSDHDGFKDIRKTNVFVGAQDVLNIIEIVRLSHLDPDDVDVDQDIIDCLSEDMSRGLSTERGTITPYIVMEDRILSLSTPFAPKTIIEEDYSEESKP